MPLFRESQLTLKWLWKDQFALADLSLLLYEFGDFTLILNEKREQHFDRSKPICLKQTQTRFFIQKIEQISLFTKNE